MIRSLRLRLFLGVIAVVIVVLGVLSIGIDQVVHHTLVAEFDRVLLEKARALASMVEQSGDKTHFDYQPEQFPEFAPGPHAAYFEISLNGQPYQHSASLGDAHLSAGGLQKAHPTAYPSTMPNGRAGRTLVLAFEPLIERDEMPAGPPPTLPQCIIAVAQDSSALDHTLQRLRWILWSLCGGATLIAGGALLAVAGRATRPVSVLAAQIESLREADLSATLSADRFPTELVPVVDRLNALLRRLGDAFARERTFTADVAHELRTPLAGLMATLEVARSRPRDAAAYESSIDKSLAMLTQMQGLVENLLLLARAESGQVSVRRAPTDVSSLVQECAATFHAAAARRELRISCALAETPAVPADREMLRLALCNLLDNAVSYAPAGSIIEIRTRSEGNAVSVEVANTGHNLTAADLPELLKRFVRKDVARSATGTHAGLGLSICQRILALQQIALALRLDAEWFVARVELPLPGVAGGDAP